MSTGKVSVCYFCVRHKSWTAGEECTADFPKRVKSEDSACFFRVRLTFTEDLQIISSLIVLLVLDCSLVFKFIKIYACECAAAGLHIYVWAQSMRRYVCGWVIGGALDNTVFGKLLKKKSLSNIPLC